MITLLDGPGAGQTLSIRRAPWMLRVVCKVKLAGNADGLFGDDRAAKSLCSWDCLDQPDDVAAADEQIYVYHLVAKPTVMFIRARKPLGGGWAMGRYKQFVAEQLPDELLRSHDAWAAWCKENRARLVELLGLEFLKGD